MTTGRSTWNYANTSQVIIDRPASEVWPFFFGSRKASWTRSDYTKVSGKEGQVGETFMHQYEVLGTHFYYFYEAVKVHPERQLVLKITCQKHAEGTREFVGYDVIHLSGAAGQTVVTLEQFLAFPTDLPQHELDHAGEKHDRFLGDILQDLKRLVESSVAG